MSDGTAPRVVRMENPVALELEPIRDLFDRAFKSVDTLPNFAEAKPDLVQLIGQPHMGVFVGVEKNEFRGLVLITLPTTAMNPYPFVALVYIGRADRGGASSALRNLLLKAGVDWIRENGYTTCWTLLPHASAKQEAVWKRMYRKVMQAEEIGKLMECKI